MNNYKISELESLSGIKAHTIRIWEQRYSILKPSRSEGNIRFYDGEQLTRLLNIVTLINAGSKISAISRLSTEEINKRVESLNNVGGEGIKEEMLINQMITSGLTFDERLFEKAFSNSILSFGFTGAYKRVFYPMLNKIGLLWTTTGFNPSQEHFISNLIRQKMLAAIDALNPTSNESEKWLLFLPENEAHELGLIVANYILRSNNKEVCYLGAVPHENLIDVAKSIQPTHLLLLVVKENQTEKTNALLDYIKVELNDPDLYLICSKYLGDTITLSNKQKCVNSFDDFLAISENGSVAFR